MTFSQETADSLKKLGRFKLLRGPVPIDYDPDDEPHGVLVSGASGLLAEAEEALGHAVTLLDRFRDDFTASERGTYDGVRMTWDRVHNAVAAAKGDDS